MIRTRLGSGWLLVSIVFAAACMPSPSPYTPTPDAQAVPAARPDSLAPRWSVRPIPVSPAFERAVEARTRTLIGRPGPRYWQQRLRYEIDAELNPETAELRGRESVTYFNQSPDTLGILVLHLYQNLFEPGARRTSEVPVTDGITIEQVTVGGREAREAELDAVPQTAEPVYFIQGTLMVLRLPAPLLPNDTVSFDMAWHFTVPPDGAPRTGHRDHSIYNVAQWYPQVAVYDDVNGWDFQPYLGAGEFYLEYADFDVSITVPEGWLVGATGVLMNEAEVLTEETRGRLRRAMETDEVVRVVQEGDRGAGRATQQSPGGQLTWRFTARDVRDFAFATSDRYLWDATHATVPQPGAGPSAPVAIHAFYPPEAPAWRDAARFTAHAISFHSRQVYPYIYPQMTSAMGPVFGMEYPMLTFVEDVPQPELLYEVINHEVAHEWFPMMVGSNESVFAWQDEGLATYMEHDATRDMFPEQTPVRSDVDRYLTIAGSDMEVPIMREADRFSFHPFFTPDELPRIVAAYSKPAIMLRALQSVIGPETMNQALREYVNRWLLKHPTEHDFFATVEDVAGQDLDWFWNPVWYETAVLDQAIVDVRVEERGGAGERVFVTIEDRGDAPMPAPLVITLADGTTVESLVPVDVWLAGRRSYTETVDVPGRVTRVEIDPNIAFPDVERADNVWERSADGN